jgi:flagellar hook-basal body complex protein FliE
MNIAPITAASPELTGVKATQEITGSPRPGKVDLADSFAKALENAHSAEHTATTAAEQFARGDAGMGIHEVMIASEKANLAIRFATTVKNKALEAYRELMNTQV